MKTKPKQVGETKTRTEQTFVEHLTEQVNPGMAYRQGATTGRWKQVSDYKRLTDVCVAKQDTAFL